MANIGKFNHLRVVKEVDFGVYLDGEELGEILLPTKSVPGGTLVDDVLGVFIYLDSDDRLIATTLKPLAKVDRFAYLEVVDVTPIGAFLNWGLPKDLLVPFREQKNQMEVGKSYIVFLYLDDTDRIVGSSKLDKFLDDQWVDIEEGELVDLIICDETPLGTKAIVNDLYWGILYKNEIFQKLTYGMRKKGCVKKIRDDEKIDLALHEPGYGKIDGMSQKVLTRLQKMGGSCSITDKSAPEAIYEQYGMSKKNFKKAVGALYKKRLIALEKGLISLIEK